MSNATELPNAKRGENYIRQNLKDRGTPHYSNRQLRRLAKHSRKNLERIQHVAKATFKDEQDMTFEEVMEEINTITAEPSAEETNSCPRCGAKGDEPCTTPKGAKAAKPHAGRE